MVIPFLLAPNFWFLIPKFSMKTPLIFLLSTAILTSTVKPSLALPPPEDTPEEILRTEIILEGRSPIDGESLTAAQYAELEAQLQERAYPPEVAGNIHSLIFLLQIRKLFTTLIPFL